MAYTSGGRASFVDKGTYNASTPYKRLDYVKYQGSIFVAKQNTTGNTPNASADTAYWTKFVPANSYSNLYDSAGTLMTQQAGLQFMNGAIENDSTNGRSKVTIGITDTEWTAIQNKYQ